MKIKRVFVTAVFVTLAFILSACAMGPRAVGAPGLSADGEMVYVSNKQFVYAVNAKTGTQVWSYPSKASTQIVFYAPPVVNEDGVYVGDLANNFYKLDKATGAELWKFSGAKGWFIGQAAIAMQTIYAPSADHSMYALNINDGSLAWKYETDHQIWSQPLALGDKIIVSSLDHFVHAVDEDGVEVWKTSLNGALVGAPVSNETMDMVFAATIGNSLYGLDASSGDVKWQFDATSGLWATPLYTQENLLVCDEAGKIYSVNPKTGELVWTIETGSKVMGGLLAIEGGFVIVTEDGNVRAYDFERKSPWNVKLTGEIYSTPVKTDENIIVGLMNSEVLLVGINLQGTQVWSFTPGK